MLNTSSALVSFNDENLSDSSLQLKTSHVEVMHEDARELLIFLYQDQLENDDASILIKDDTLNLFVGSAISYRGLKPVDGATKIKSSVATDSLAPRTKLKILGTLPFDVQGDPSQLYLPTLAITATPSRVAITVVAVDDQQCNDLISDAIRKLTSGVTVSWPNRALLERLELTYFDDEPGWLRSVQYALDQINFGNFDKIVLSRQASMPQTGGFSRTAIINQLNQTYPQALTFSTNNLIGASPELLIEVTQSHIQSHPLAGTAPKDQAKKLQASTKDQREHKYVTTFIKNRLLPFCQYLTVPDSPSISDFGNICHLGTRIAGELINSGRHISSLELLLAIHPTPAVAGLPQDQAIAFIQRYESPSRHLYAGAVGYEDFEGNGQWHLIIRTIAILENSIAFQAGVGLVAESNPLSELLELEEKINSVLTITSTST